MTEPEQPKDQPRGRHAAPEQGTRPVQRPSSWPAPPQGQPPQQPQWQQPPAQPPQPQELQPQQPQQAPPQWTQQQQQPQQRPRPPQQPPPTPPQQQQPAPPQPSQPSQQQPPEPKVLPERTAKWEPPPADAPDVTSVLQAEAPPTQFVAPPKPEAANAAAPELPDPGTESLRPIDAEPDSQPRTGSGGTGSGTGTGTGSGSRSTGSGTFTSSRRGSSRSRSSRRGGLGAGLVEVPPVPYLEPASAVMENPVVAENKRFCGSCNSKVGRGEDGKPGPTEGKCAKCGAAFSFTPKLTPGEVLGGR